jgi:hypothetical protein
LDYLAAADAVDVDYRNLDIVHVANNFLVNTVIVVDKETFCCHIHAEADPFVAVRMAVD